MTSSRSYPQGVEEGLIAVDKTPVVDPVDTDGVETGLEYGVVALLAHTATPPESWPDAPPPPCHR